MKHPKISGQVIVELDVAASRDELSSPVQYAEALTLPLLCATTKEAMRLHPSVGFHFAENCASWRNEDCWNIHPSRLACGNERRRGRSQRRDLWS